MGWDWLSGVEDGAHPTTSYSLPLSHLLLLSPKQAPVPQG